MLSELRETPVKPTEAAVGATVVKNTMSLHSTSNVHSYLTFLVQLYDNGWGVRSNAYSVSSHSALVDIVRVKIVECDLSS